VFRAPLDEHPTRCIRLRVGLCLGLGVGLGTLPSNQILCTTPAMATPTGRACQPFINLTHCPDTAIVAAAFDRTGAAEYVCVCVFGH
jgi:hypothetical protein